MRDRRRIATVMALSSLCFIINHLSANQVSQEVERKLSVVSEKTPIYLEPSVTSPIIGNVARKTVLTSYRSEGEWYRVMLPPDRDNISLIGYIAAKDVTVVEEKPIGKPDYWGTSGKKYEGIGLEITLGAGYTYFGGGDFADGVRGMVDEFAASIGAMGYPVVDRDVRGFHSGVHFAADLAYRISPRFSIGLGGEYIHAWNFDRFGLMDGIYYDSANCTPILQAFIIRPGIYLKFPLSNVLSVRLDGGPAVFITDFEYNLITQTRALYESFHWRAHDVALGVQAGVGLEVNLNERIGLVLRTTGRYARAASFKGDEKFEGVVNSLDTSGPQYTGNLYFLHRGAFPVLTVRPDAPSSDARSAVLDYAGIDFSLGLRIRF